MTKSTKEEITIVEANITRKSLSEGRCFGMGFAFCKKEGNTYTLLHPQSTCKDYLNDIVVSNISNRKITAYGLVAQISNLIEDNSCYLVLSILPFQNGPEYENTFSNFKSDVTRLNNIDNIIKVVNHIEEQLNIPLTTIDYKSDNRYIIKLSHIWASESYLISLYSLLLRVALYYTTGNIDNFLEESIEANKIDGSLLRVALPKLKNLIKSKKFPKIKYSNMADYQIHNRGICSEIYTV